MKLTDCQLLNLFWEAQLKQIAYHGVTNFIGGRYGVSMDRDQDVERITSICPFARSKITKKISKSHLLKRIYRLHEEGKLSKNMWGYRLESSNLGKAYELIKLELEKSLPKGFSNGSFNSAECENISEVKEDAYQLAIKYYPNWYIN